MQKEKFKTILKEIAMEFAYDIKEYIELGGSINNITASEVYKLIEEYESDDS